MVLARAWCLAFAAAAGLAGAACAGVALDSDVKAAYLSKMGLFVEWPASAFPTPTSPVTVCIVGDNPFGDTLDKLVEGQHVGGRPIVVRYLKSVAARSGCGIVYIGPSETASAGPILSAIAGESVLTVTDGAGEGAPSGVINFVNRDNRVRFIVDAHAAAQRRLVISSHLLSLAFAVRQDN